MSTLLKVKGFPVDLPVDKAVTAKTANYTLTAAESGAVVTVDTLTGTVASPETITITYPPTVIGYNFEVVSIAEAGTLTLVHAPNASDKFIGSALAGDDNKAITFTACDPGDRLKTLGTGGDGYAITGYIGTATVAS